MKRTDLNRRDFNKLAAAAFGGVVTGTAIGCSKSKSPDKTDGGKSGDGKSGKSGEDEVGKLDDTPNPWTGEKHVCKGLNACKGKGADKMNDCVGQGTCATVKHSSCHKENECRYLGGCHESVGQNACAGKGECKIPLGEDTWKKARAAFEKAMAKADKKPADSSPPKM